MIELNKKLIKQNEEIKKELNEIKKNNSNQNNKIKSNIKINNNIDTINNIENLNKIDNVNIQIHNYGTEKYDQMDNKLFLEPKDIFKLLKISSHIRSVK